MTTHEENGAAYDASGRRLDQIRLSGITATGYHGVFDHERREGQTFVADVVVHLDTRRAAAGDDLAHTLDYGGLAQQVAAVLAGEPVDLIETVAERIAATVLAAGTVAAVDVAVHKPQAPIPVPFGDVVVAIRRDRTKLPAAEPYTGPLRESALPRTGAAALVAPLPGDTHGPSAAYEEPRAADVGGADARTPALGTPSPAAGLPVSGMAGGGLAAPASTSGGALPSAPAGLPAGAPSTGVPSGAPVAPGYPAPGSGAPVPADDAPTTVFGAPPPPPGPITGEPVEVGAGPDAAGPTGSAVEAWDPGATQVMPGPVPAYDDEPDAYGRPDEVVTGEIVTDTLDDAPAEPVDVVLALGANLGSAQETLRDAVSDLAGTRGIEVTDVSPLARTAAVGPEQPDYLNAVVLARTTLSPRDLLRATQAVEHAHGRERAERWGPRTLDVDIVVYGSVLAVTDDLELPHPRAHERAFVLEPWSQVDPEAVLPGLGGGPVAQLAATAPDRGGVRWLALDWLTAPVPGTSGVPVVEADAPSGPVPTRETVFGTPHDGPRTPSS
ncbi:2-amino-4-hydroxy-6-hydroxymethyldihydropteridine diphosphokinase [Cellulomonas sp. H30R-01]|uniref:2-amino-4-hydroxy-6- hydroxymethyldihydropteridine diphosphokinase n=1 Tax=Cellulomonas sp. H30R-01 TaxID=2704467 RepID=UPI00138B4471|nr:2-amino-4-hydroxy-6-hydroxymethyldihydropteridine diphosphokinase [Cellulomonas sp. H30R-01]QHT58004.1 2-amino-4-hydroxy-6-hydroxymethyldihydropteridine diphosphokinase [Cellulomonas sp. H30R-01]